jgi:predicted esterase
MSIYVVFIGGYKASQPAVDLWLASARKQRSDVVFDAYPYPEGKKNWGDDDAVNGFQKFDEAVKKIEDSGADTIFIVGHSSGCAIANELNSRLKGDHKNVTLVDLDGFAPRPKQIKGASVQAWSAEGSGPKDRSLNWAKGKKMYHSAQATKNWSLHFSLVNTAATDDITGDNFETEGYAGCIANLDFLK